MTPLKTWRRIAVIVIVASLALAALLGIIALFSGEFGELQVRILLSTLLIAGFSVVALCDLTIAERRLRLVGFIGAALSLVTFALGLVLIWLDWNDGTGELLRWFFIAGIVALSFAQASLLLLLSDRASHAVRIALWITLAFVAVVTIMAVLPIATDGAVPGTGDEATYWRFFGAAVIIDAVGTIAVPVVALIARAATQGTARGHSTVTLPPELAGRLDRYAVAVGADRDEIVAYAVTEHLDRYGSSPDAP